MHGRGCAPPATWRRPQMQNGLPPPPVHVPPQFVAYDWRIMVRGCSSGRDVCGLQCPNALSVLSGKCATPWPSTAPGLKHPSRYGAASRLWTTECNSNAQNGNPQELAVALSKYVSEPDPLPLIREFVM